MCRSKNRFRLKLVGPHLRPTSFVFLYVKMTMIVFVLSTPNETGRTSWDVKGMAVLRIEGLLNVGYV